MKEELYNKIDKFCNETDWSKYPTYEHALEEFIKEIVEEETKELEKENAELKKDKKELCHSISEGGKACVYLNEQLNKAKNLLQKVADVCGYPNYDIPVVLYSEIADFLKDGEVEK